MSELTQDTRVERSAKRVRAYYKGAVVADTTAARLVWENPHYPIYYLPLADTTEAAASSPGAVLPGPQAPVAELRDTVRLDPAAMDAWFEEDVEVFGHPRNPYTRIDALRSSRHVEVRMDGVTIADTTHPVLLFETGLPVRYYLPKPDVRMDLLRPTDSSTLCPYKGFAEYWSAEIGGTVHEDLAWSYRTPLPESREVAGLVAFPQERVELLVDGTPA